MKCKGLPFLPVPFSPVQRARKFSAVFGTTCMQALCLQARCDYRESLGVVLPSLNWQESLRWLLMTCSALFPTLPKRPIVMRPAGFPSISTSKKTCRMGTSEGNCSDMHLARIAIHAWAQGHCSFLDHLDSFFRTLLVISGLLLFFLPATAFKLSMHMHNAARHARRSPLRPANAILKIA